MKKETIRIIEANNRMIHNTPLEEHLLDQIKDYFRIGLTYSSNAIEGNTLTESETKIVLKEGTTIGGKTAQRSHGGNRS